MCVYLWLLAVDWEYNTFCILSVSYGGKKPELGGGGGGSETLSQSILWIFMGVVNFGRKLTVFLGVRH